MALSKTERWTNIKKKLSLYISKGTKTETVKIKNKSSNANGLLWMLNSYHILNYILANLVIPFFDHTLKASEKYYSFYSEIYFFCKIWEKTTISIYFSISIHWNRFTWSLLICSELTKIILNWMKLLSTQIKHKMYW